MNDLGVELSANALITSKTDLSGKIVYINSDFVKYSGFSEREVFGKPHNIVRHGDMPRAVFKLLWSYVKSGKEVFAFVKNKTKDGGHYWVFANVTPSYDMAQNIVGFYSVRRQANPKAIAQIARIYAQMKEAESRSVGESEAVLGAILQESKMSYNQLILAMQNGGFSGDEILSKRRRGGASGGTDNAPGNVAGGAL